MQIYECSNFCINSKLLVSLIAVIINRAVIIIQVNYALPPLLLITVHL